MSPFLFFLFFDTLHCIIGDGYVIFIVPIFVSTVKKTKWNSCRDQFRREVTEMVRSGEGAPKKRPYIYTEQLRFLRPVMDLRLTVDSLEDPEPQPSPQSDPGGAETPPVFSPEMSPTNLAEEESEGVQRGLAGPGEVNPDDSQRPQSRRRRSAPQASSGITTKEVIDSQVIQYLAQKRAEGCEEVLMRGLAPLLQVPQEKQAACIASITLVLEMYRHPYQGDIHSLIDRVRRQVVLGPHHQQQGSLPPRAATHHAPYYSQQNLPLSQDSNPPFGQPNYPPTYPTGAQDPAQVRPGPSYAAGSFTRDLMDL
ncbi:uncharacterized protein LOC122922971 [Bufo gargarizans]|uniref:uncharacterized protein LOC122922971 n=1 Tax=Bufo gargarizans TaxID=30331 RepID=UPI001CF23670|nr:uncharacterized protein LOC122922971 [Bufo gargarizans]